MELRRTSSPGSKGAVQTPYTSYPLDAFMAAQASAGATVFAVGWSRRPGAAACVAFAVAVACAVLAPVEAGFFASLGLAPGPERLSNVLRGAMLLGALASLLAGRPWTAVAGLVLEVGLSRLRAIVTESDWELSALHLIALGALAGTWGRANELARRSATGPRRALGVDLATFAVATSLAALVAHFVLLRSTDSSDEWAYTFQSHVFAKGRAYATMPPCAPALESFWVFSREGRLFSQYPPGWPLFAAPFAVLRIFWLAGPFTHGLLAVGVARLARRATADDADPERPSWHAVRAGLVAAACVTTGSTMLINGGSRFAHTFVCACFAWAVEGLCAAASRGASRRCAWGAVSGTAAAFMLASRVADGGLLGIGLTIYFFWALARRRLHWKAALVLFASFAVWVLVALVLLRLQLGRWFETGYSLTRELRGDWAVFKLSAPRPNELRWGVPLATGSYCWWPSAPAVGVAGMVLLARTAARRIAFLLSVGSVALLAFYSFVEFGRGWDFGYGPRYTLPVVVLMAVGAGAALGPAWTAAASRHGAASAWSRGGPLAVALLAAVIGVVRIAPLVYPANYEDVRLRNLLSITAQEHGLHHAIVLASPGTTIGDPLDLAKNLPVDLYPEQDVIYASDRMPDAETCLRHAFPDRAFYRASGRTQITLEPR
jgi:hypothetical protein